MWKFVTIKKKLNDSVGTSFLSRTEVEAANNQVSSRLQSATEKVSRGKYNSYTPQQRAKIGKYAAENGPTRAAKHFTATWGIQINESTARRFKSEYLNKLDEAIKSAKGEGSTSNTVVAVDKLEIKQKGRPLLLGTDLDAAVQEYIQSLRMAGGVVNTLVVMGAAEGIVAVRDVSKLVSHGGHIEITKTWARSLLIRMGFVKRKCSTSGKIPMLQLEELKEVFLADLAAEVVMKDIPKELILNWDQTGVPIIPTGDWTMEKEGASRVSIAHADDKRQLTAVLAVTAAGEYLGPQLLYKGKTVKCHPQTSFPDGWDIWHSENHWSNEETMERYIKKIVIPFVTRKREILKLEAKHPALAIFDGFKGQTTVKIHSLLAASNIVAIQLPPNTTDKLQPLDLSVNKPVKDGMKAKFQRWYANEVKRQLQTTPVNQIKVDVNLAVVKNPSAGWLISVWQSLEKRPEVAINGFKNAGIIDAIDI